MSRPPRRTVNATGVADRQPSTWAPAQRCAETPLDGLFLGRGATCHGDDLIAGLQDASGGLSALDRRDLGRAERLHRRVEVAQRHGALEAAAEQDPPEQQKRDQDVDGGTGEDHDDPLPRLLVVVCAPGDLRVEIADFFGAHAGDLHVATSGDRADRILGLAPTHTQKRGREEQREALHAHAHRLGRGEVPELVQHDQQHDAKDGQDPAHRSQCATATPASPSVAPACKAVCIGSIRSSPLGGLSLEFSIGALGRSDGGRNAKSPSGRRSLPGGSGFRGCGDAETAKPPRGNPLSGWSD